MTPNEVAAAQTALVMSIAACLPVNADLFLESVANELYRYVNLETGAAGETIKATMSLLMASEINTMLAPCSKS